MALTFSGGIDLQKSGKAPAGKIKYFDEPPYIIADFSQERGVSFEPFVAEGEPVAKYQVIGEQKYKGDSAPVYSGVSGVVGDILRREDGSAYAVVIGLDGRGRQEELKPYGGTLENLIPDLAIELIRRAGITCRGAHKFAYRKIRAANGETLRFFLNCCESEPGVTSRKALLNEDMDAVLNVVRPVLSEHFRPALLARMTIVPYRSLESSAMGRITELKLRTLARRLKENKGMELTWSQEVIDQIVARCSETETGARNIGYILSGSVLPRLAHSILEHMTDGAMPASVALGVGEDGAFTMDFA